MSRQKPREELSPVERAVQIAIGEGRTFGNVSDPAREKFPTLWEWLTRAYLGQDYIKQPATMSIAANSAGFTVKLVDRDLSSSCIANTTNLEDAFAAIEVILANGQGGWTHWGKKEPHLRKRKKSD